MKVCNRSDDFYGGLYQERKAVEWEHNLAGDLLHALPPVGQPLMGCGHPRTALACLGCSTEANLNAVKAVVKAATEWAAECRRLRHDETTGLPYTRAVFRAVDALAMLGQPQPADGGTPECQE